MLWLRDICQRMLVRAMEMAGWGTRVLPISAASLASLANGAGESLILIDVRDTQEIETRSFSIPGALISAHVNLRTLIRWVPHGSTVVVFAADDLSAHDGRLRVPMRKLKMYALEGGLRAWCKAGLPLEPVTLSGHRWVDNR